MQRLIPSKHHTTPILRTFLQHRYRTRLYFATMASSPSQPRALSGNTNADTDTDTVAAPLNQQPPLSGRRDVYDGLIIDPDTIPPTPTAFKQELASALHTWRTVDGYRGVWLKIPLSKAHHIGHAVEAGFVFHHAEPGYCMLTHWLPPTENKLPPNASHQVGVGAFCFDRATRQVLVVQEKHGPLKGLKVWKMPTGLVNAGEDITEAAVREVKEETGIDATFVSVLAMRQAHGLSFGKSDMFFLVALEPRHPAGSASIQLQEDEVEAAAWIGLDEYTSIQFHLERPLLKKLMERCVAWVNGKYPGLAGYKMASGFSEREDLLLFGESVEEGAQPRLENEDAWIGLR